MKLTAADRRFERAHSLDAEERKMQRLAAMRDRRYEKAMLDRDRRYEKARSK